MGPHPDHVPKGYSEALFRIRHSAAHIMAQAVTDVFKGEGPVKLGVGPPIEDGFYYDFLLPRPLVPADMERVEARMKAIMRGHHPFALRQLSFAEAREFFNDQPFKLELLDGFEAGSVDDHGNPLPSGEAIPITVYTHDTFSDLCRGPHVAATDAIDPEAVKLLRFAAAYWKGDENRPQLQRIYGTAWETRDELAGYLTLLSEAEKRDHRRLGRELELFHMDATAPGMPYWLPRGFQVLTELIDFWRREHRARGYQEISSPLVNNKTLWETSGHWEHYKDNMFIIPVSEHVTYALKPMNCPNAMVVYNLKRRSYRDLPLRLSDCDILHRYERSGTLHGLLRVQKLQQDDAHIFVREEQIEEEYDRVLEITDLFYRIFDLDYSFRVGTRPESFIGDIETWNRAEAALKRILDRRVGPDAYRIEEGDGAFYGPKIDIVMKDCLNRQWQMGTIQLDFQLPRRFQCVYVDNQGREQTPVVIHRVIYGSLERFIGILIEQTAGAFPVWLAPVQSIVIPIADAHVAYGAGVRDQLTAAGFRVELDDSDKRMNAKIRDAQLQKVPYMLVVGRREMETATVSVRLRTGEDLGSMPLGDFVERGRKVVEAKKGI